MDETTRTEQDTPSGNPGQSSGSKGRTTSKDKGKLYTDAQIAKIKSDTAAVAGRQRKAAEHERDSLKQELQSTTSRLDALEREIDESRLAEARGDPEQLRTYQREQATKKREREVADQIRDLARREEQLKSDRAEVDKDRGIVSIAYIAAEHGLEIEELESLGISDHDTLERVAAKLAGSKPKETGTEEGEEIPTAGLTPDSGLTTGGLTGIAALAKANEDFSKGLITEKQLQEIASKTK